MGILAFLKAGLKAEGRGQKAFFKAEGRRQRAEGFKEKGGKKSGFGIRHEASSGLR